VAGALETWLGLVTGALKKCGRVAAGGTGGGGGFALGLDSGGKEDPGRKGTGFRKCPGDQRDAEVARYHA